MRSFARSVMSDDERREVEAVEMLADHLRDELVEREVAINQAHVVGAQSAAIQAIVADNAARAVTLDDDGAAGAR